MKLRLIKSRVWVLHGARRRLTQGACSSLPLALMGGECLPPGPRTCTCRWLRCCNRSHHGEASTDLASLRLLHTARLMRTQGRCMLVFAAGTLRLRVLAARTTPTHLQVVCLFNTNRHGAPTDRASLRLLHKASQRPTQSACSSLLLALSGGECFPPGSRTCTCRFPLQRTPP